MQASEIFGKKVAPRLEASRADWLAAARRVALRLGRKGDLVTIAQVRAHRDCPPIGEGVDPRVCGVVFTRADWVLVDRVGSGVRVSHNRPIGRFLRVEFAGQ